MMIRKRVRASNGLAAALLGLLTSTTTPLLVDSSDTVVIHADASIDSESSSTTKLFDLDWDELDESTRQELRREGHSQLEWDTFGKDLRWYYLSSWNELTSIQQEALSELGWTESAWQVKYNEGYCIYQRPLVELRSFSRMTDAEQAIARRLGFDEYTWHTKEFAMTAWQPNDGETVEQLKRPPAVLLPNNGFEPIHLKLDIPEFKEMTFDKIRQATHQILVVQDPDADAADFGNDENGDVLKIPAPMFVDGIRQHDKAYYIKYENDRQEAIQTILTGSDDLDPAQILSKYLQDTPVVADLARLGPKFAGEECEQYLQLYVGGPSSITNMHIDIQSFNFLYVVEGRKRIRLLPNDQRYAQNFTWGLEAHYSVWTGFDLLNEEPLPEHGVELILGPGEGVAVPYHTWHAVENLEPSIAFGLIRDFPFTSSSKLCGGSNEWVKQQQQQTNEKQHQQRAAAPSESIRLQRQQESMARHVKEWYEESDWMELTERQREMLGRLGWNGKDWDYSQSIAAGCVYKRPLCELRPWSRLTHDEQVAAYQLGFDEWNWHTKEFKMTAWQPHVDERDIRNASAIKGGPPAVLLPNNGFEPLYLKLDIPELARLTFDLLEGSPGMVEVEDPTDKSTDMGNDETVRTMEMSLTDFIQGIKRGEPYYIKYEYGEQGAIADILGVDPAEVLAEYLEGTKVGDVARIGDRFEGELAFSESQLYIGGKSSTTNMHLDIQNFNFLWVAAGRKRIRLLPNDERYAANFTVGLEAYYSVWTGFDLLNAEPIPEHGVELILGPGEGVAVPYHTWHAVENLEPTIAFGLIRDFPYTVVRKQCREDYD